MVRKLSHMINYTTIYKRYYEFLRILNQKNIKSLFQPIVSLKNGEILGYEALSRGPAGSDFESPLVLLAYAKENDFLWDIEYLCRQQALENSRSFLQEGQLLFINVDADIFNDSKYQSGLTKKSLEEYGISAKNVVFEITEHNSVASQDLYATALKNYREQGYQIAIDDVGTGYSNLSMLVATRPEFLKIDMALVRDIDKDLTKQSLLKTFKSFCQSSGIKMIAEGIETLDELETLIRIGVDYGQGYFLKRPSQTDFILNKDSQNQIKLLADLNCQGASQCFPLDINVGSIAKSEVTVDVSAQGHDLDKIFRSHPEILGVPVLEDGRPIGLVMRNKFYFLIGRQYGLELFLKKNVAGLMDSAPMILDYNMPIRDVSRTSMNRDNESIYDHIIIIQDGLYFRVVTIKDLLEKTSQIELSIARHSNPLTGLPGNIMIEKNLQECLESGKDYCVLYLDLDNFKPFNDKYGFERGDLLISLTGQIAKNQLDNICNLKGNSAFIGHIGGDDFVITLPGSIPEGKALAENIIKNFEKEKRVFFPEDDIKLGYFYEKNRQGKKQRFNLTSLSISLVYGKSGQYRSVFELSEAAGKIKSLCKGQEGSVCVIG